MLKSFGRALYFLFCLANLCLVKNSSIAQEQKQDPHPPAPEIQGPPTQELLPRKFFLLFDFAFNNGIGLEKARKAAAHFIDHEVLPTDEISLLSYSAAKSLKLHE